MSDFQSVPVTAATSYWGTSSAGFVNNPNHYSIEMKNVSETHVLATTNNLDSNSDFTNTFVQCK
jgi:hypothetical protein